MDHGQDLSVSGGCLPHLEYRSCHRHLYHSGLRVSFPFDLQAAEVFHAAEKNAAGTECREKQV